ncbi:10858_t:CDS:1, partial [Racocetra persica]
SSQLFNITLTQNKEKQLTSIAAITIPTKHYRIKINILHQRTPKVTPTDK